MNHPPTLRDRIRSAAAHGDWTSALRIAASCPGAWGPWAPTIARAHEASWCPHFGRQLGRTPADDIANGIAALRYLLNIEDHPMTTAPARKAAKKPARRPRKPDTAPAGINTAPEPEAAPERSQSAPLAMTTDELNHGGKRIGVGMWEKFKDGARIVVTHDRRTGMWNCVIERGDIRAERSGHGYLTICRATIDAFNQGETTR